jgi:chemotaxis protein CheD
MENHIYVQTGEVKTGQLNDIIKSSPIGSCAVVILFDESIQIAGMAHIMLPGKAPLRENIIKNRYAEDAIKTLIEQLAGNGLEKDKLKAVLVGGGNVLKRNGDTIGIDNIKSVEMILSRLKIPIVAKKVGGTERYATKFDINAGIIYYTIGDNPEEILFRI